MRDATLPKTNTEPYPTTYTLTILLPHSTHLPPTTYALAPQDNMYTHTSRFHNYTYPEIPIHQEDILAFALVDIENSEGHSDV